KTGVLPSLPPTYPVHPLPKSNIRLQSSSTGSFRPVAGNGHHHPYFIFTGPPVETALKSLHHSCGSELTRQGISLPSDRYSYGRRLLGPRFCASLAMTFPLNIPAPGRCQHLYVSSRFRRYLCFC